MFVVTYGSGWITAVTFGSDSVTVRTVLYTRYFYGLRFTVTRWVAARTVTHTPRGWVLPLYCPFYAHGSVGSTPRCGCVLRYAVRGWLHTLLLYTTHLCGYTHTPTRLRFISAALRIPLPVIHLLVVTYSSTALRTFVTHTVLVTVTFYGLLHITHHVTGSGYTVLPPTRLPVHPTYGYLVLILPVTVDHYGSRLVTVHRRGSRLPHLVLYYAAARYPFGWIAGCGYCTHVTVGSDRTHTHTVGLPYRTRFAVGSTLPCVTLPALPVPRSYTPHHTHHGYGLHVPTLRTLPVLCSSVTGSRSHSTHYVVVCSYTFWLLLHTRCRTG